MNSLRGAIFFLQKEPRALLAGAVALLLLLSPCVAEVPASKGPEEDAALPLPRWSDAEIRAFRENFSGPGGLLPAAEEPLEGAGDALAAPLSFGPRLDPHSQAELPRRLQPEDMRLFLPDSLLTQPTPPRAQPAIPRPTALSTLKEVTPEFLATAAAALPSEYLIDPGTLVTEMHQQEMTRFLDFHAHDALIKLHALILPGDRKLPADCNLDAVCSGSLAKGTACLLVYPLGEPWRARLFLSKAVHDHASQEFMKETVRACVEEALQCSDVHDQLRSFTVELSTRLFWLQKALGTKLGSPAGASRPLAEISPDAPAPTPLTAPQQAFPWLTTCLLTGITLAGVAARPLWHRVNQWRRLRRQSRVWMLPEVETVPRLGGAFTGGGGGMISYAKPAS